MANNVVEILTGVVNELKQMARSESVIGDPITIGDKTVIPVVKISVGFGAGGGQGEGTAEGQKASGTGFGGGGGGGAKIEPSAFIIIDKDKIKLLPTKKGSWQELIDTIPNIAEKFSSLKEKFSSEKSDGDKEDVSDEESGEE